MATPEQNNCEYYQECEFMKLRNNGNGNTGSCGINPETCARIRYMKATPDERVRMERACNVKGNLLHAKLAINEPEMKEMFPVIEVKKDGKEKRIIGGVYR